jgi:hypothetical protein
LTSGQARQVARFSSSRRPQDRSLALGRCTIRPSDRDGGDDITKRPHYPLDKESAYPLRNP